MSSTDVGRWFVVIILLVIATTFAQLSLFIPTLRTIESMQMSIKLLLSVILLFIQWMFIIPVIRIGLKIMNPIQITILAFVVTFIVQLVTNVYVFGNKNTIDDYIASVIMILGILISKMGLFG
jgi:uncharacterized protein (DUF486 family)